MNILGEIPVLSLLTSVTLIGNHPVINHFNCDNKVVDGQLRGLSSLELLHDVL